jgi:hypothetical protein
LQRTPRGRMLTEAGYKHIGLTLPAGRQGDWFSNLQEKTDDDA